MTTAFVILAALAANPAPSPSQDAPLIRSVRGGSWSDRATWGGDRVPSVGDRVQIREGHRVVYDLASDAPIRSIHVAGALSFAPDRNTQLVVGLLKVQPGEDASEEGFDCVGHIPTPPAIGERRPPSARLEVGSAERPIADGKTAKIRLAHAAGLDPASCPAIVSCGGRMEFHGTPISRTWTKLMHPANRGDVVILVHESEVVGWKPGDRIIVTGTTRQFGYKMTRTTSVAERPATEERVVREIKRHSQFDEVVMTLDRPLDGDHRAAGDYRAEVANLSRNVVIESADPSGIRGHTMYHRNSAGSISYVEFRHLGKEGVLGRYSLHFHLAGDSLRGASVVGASFWDSKNRWITVHGTSHLVVRDCVGYKSVGHGFFLEDGTETRNHFDRNLAVQALRGKPLPGQMLPYDENLGSGFWWANSLNSFTRNVATECDQDGFRYDVFASDKFSPELMVPKPDGTKARVDIRTLPFIRFESNEAHCMRFFGINLGGFDVGGVPPYSAESNVLVIRDVDGVGPDQNHPFIIRNFRAWDCHWAFHAGSPAVYVEGMDLSDSEYALWRSVIDRHEYHDLKMDRIKTMSVFFPRPGRAAKDGPLAQLKRVDDLPPSTMTTYAGRTPGGTVVIRGTTIDDGTVSAVLVNGQVARAVEPNFTRWEVTLDAPPSGDIRISAHAKDTAGNVEPRPHVLTISPATD